MAQESMKRFFECTRGRWYARAYTFALAVAAVQRCLLLACIWPFQRVAGLGAGTRRSLDKWLAILRWAVGRETWVRKYDKTDSNRYVLITPVRNEEKTIEITLRSVINQTLTPAEWVIVSDESTDRTDEIISRYSAKYEFIQFLRLTKRPSRNFASVVFAVEAGYAALKTNRYRLSRYS